MANKTDPDNTADIDMFNICYLISMPGIQHQCSATGNLMRLYLTSLTHFKSE